MCQDKEHHYFDVISDWTSSSREERENKVFSFKTNKGIGTHYGLKI